MHEEIKKRFAYYIASIFFDFFGVEIFFWFYAKKINLLQFINFWLHMQYAAYEIGWKRIFNQDDIRTDIFINHEFYPSDFHFIDNGSFLKKSELLSFICLNKNWIRCDWNENLSLFLFLSYFFFFVNCTIQNKQSLSFILVDKFIFLVRI